MNGNVLPLHRCKARHRGLRCERERWHRGYHRAEKSNVMTVEWACILRLVFWRD